ncbi:N-acetyl-lysine deacetylase [Candidatus Nitrosotalea sp. TS]|uniref:M20/M25/M40 family metallo-hydrolase n=2 Tax=Candidatus Nitrosotalea sp. TS TaxID=2341020 RepID=UPI001408AD78|nr:M20/M25/M40 family metallo-hydrolase [Candidatus Nitrosotalea sp. TS]NHI03500.1 N-acetyl-lysine deacetylase [Candidatus Nitrosotalea sp. TS]
MDSSITITPRYSVKMLEKALRLYTPSLSEKALAEFLADKCDDLGFENIHIDEVGNLIATKGSGSPKILLCGHMDTVPGKIKVRNENGHIYGRGASDAKAPLMSMLLAAASVQNSNGTVVFAAVVDEEGNATGIKSLVKQKLDIDYAIFGEPSGIKNITIAYKGRIAINLKINVGDSAHASAPWLAKNAIEESYIFTTAIKKALEGNQEGKPKSMMLTAVLTEIKGGTSHNVTAVECDAIMDIRIPVDMNCKMVGEKIATTVQEVAKKQGVNAFYSILDETEPFEAPHTSPLVRALTLGILDVEKARPQLIRKTGTGDMNIIGNALSIPVVTYGPGDPHASHTIDEHVSSDEYLRSIEVFKRMLDHLKRLHDNHIGSGK